MAMAIGCAGSTLLGSNGLWLAERHVYHALRCRRASLERLNDMGIG